MQSLTHGALTHSPQGERNSNSGCLWNSKVTEPESVCWIVRVPEGLSPRAGYIIMRSGLPLPASSRCASAKKFRSGRSIASAKQTSSLMMRPWHLCLKASSLSACACQKGAMPLCLSRILEVIEPHGHLIISHLVLEGGHVSDISLLDGPWFFLFLR